MLETVGYLIAITAVVIGTLFSIVGVLGYLRLPDVYTKLHAIGKVSVFGVVFLLIATIFLPTLGWARGLVLISLLLLASPVISHAAQSAAYRLRVPMEKPVTDALKTEWLSQRKQVKSEK